MSPLERRTILQNQMELDEVLIVSSGEEKVRNADANYRFRASSDFLYLTGFKEPNATLVMTKETTLMFMEEKDDFKELWHGFRLGTKAGVEVLQVDKCFSNESYLLKTYSGSSERVQNLLTSMRMIKDHEEVKKMRNSSLIAMSAHQRAMRLSQFKEAEFNIQAIFDGKFTSNNVEHAYVPIVASGKNALCLHYTANNSRLEAGDMLLIDAGCEYEGYASDITRTFPVDGEFNPQQVDVYSVCLEANKKAIKSIKPGITMEELDTIAREEVYAGLKDIGDRKSVV